MNPNSLTMMDLLEVREVINLLKHLKLNVFTILENYYYVHVCVLVLCHCLYRRLNVDQWTVYQSFGKTMSMIEIILECQ